MVESVSNNIQNQQHQLKDGNASNPKPSSVDAEASRLAQEINNNTLLKQKALKSASMNQNQGGKRTFGGVANSANILNPTNAANKDVPMKRTLEGSEQPQENNKENSEAPAKPLWDDLDAEDMDDPLMVAEYVQDIVKYMRQLEVFPSFIDLGFHCANAELHGLPKGDQLEHAEHPDRLVD